MTYWTKATLDYYFHEASRLVSEDNIAGDFQGFLKSIRLSDTEVKHFEFFEADTSYYYATYSCSHSSYDPQKNVAQTIVGIFLYEQSRWLPRKELVEPTIEEQTQDAISAIYCQLADDHEKEQFNLYLKDIASKTNKTGLKGIVVKPSQGIIELREGKSLYNTYTDIQDALFDAFNARLNT